MATIRTIEGKRGTRYRAIVRKRGETATRTFSTKTDANRWAHKLEAEIERGAAGLVTAGQKWTLSQAIDKYIAEILPEKAAGTQPTYRKQLLWWKSRLGSYRLADITGALISEHRDALLQENYAPKDKPPKYRSPSTTNRYLEALGSVFREVTKRWHWLPDTPMRAVQKLREPRGRTRFLSATELTALMDACRQAREPDLYLAVLMALTTAARKGTILSLRWEWIDLTGEVAHVPKTKNGDPIMLPLVPEVVQLLKARRDAGGITRVQGLVFPSKVSDSQPVLIEAAWRAARKRAGLTDFRFHDLRHSAASYLAMNGATLPEIGDVLGHRSAQSTNRYAHIAQGHTHSLVRDTMSKVLGGSDE